MIPVILRLLALALLVLAFLWLIGMKIVARIADWIHFAAPCPVSFGWVLESPLRRWYLRKVPERIGFRVGERVLEIGPGLGVFTRQAAEHVGAAGQVVALDVQPEMARRLAHRMKIAGLEKVRIVVGNAEALPFVSGYFDRAFAVSVMAEVRNKTHAFSELYRALKGGGMLSITEEFLDPDYPFPAETSRRAGAAGFQFVQRAGGLWTYTSNFRKPAPEGVPVSEV